MRRWTVQLAAVMAMVGAAAVGADAQDRAPRGHLSVNGTFQGSRNDFGDRFEFESNAEQGSAALDYGVETGPAFDGGAGIRVWRSLGIGASVSYFTAEHTARAEARVPHPFFDNRLREVSGGIGGLARTEVAVHLQVMYLLDPPGPLRLVLTAGPSLFAIDQDIVDTVQVWEEYPFDEAALTGGRLRPSSGSSLGFNVGADLTWMIGRRLGVGGLVRFSRASVDLDAPGGRPLGVDAGGLQAGGGLRILF
jgi:hypothetical protein